MLTPLQQAARAAALLALACVGLSVASLPISAQRAGFLASSNQIAFHSDRDGDWEIYVMNADGSGQRALTSNTIEDRDPVWSPDGRTIAFTSRRDGNIEIYLVQADGTGLRRLTNHPATDFSPAFSPDGKQVAFGTDRDRQTDIYVVRTDGTNVRRFTTSELDDWRPVWSPDGTEIAFLSGRDGGQSDGSGEIYIRDAAGRLSERRLVKETRRAQYFSWSPDSARIVLFMVAARKFEIAVVDRSGANEANLSAVASSAMDTEPVWSPDGKRIAFLGGTATGMMGVFVMAPDGSGRTQISSPDAPATGPLSWSPDSTGVLHTQTLDGNMEIVLSRTGGSTFRRLTSNKAADQAASFARQPNVGAGSKS